MSKDFLGEEVRSSECGCVFRVVTDTILDTCDEHTSMEGFGMRYGSKYEPNPPHVESAIRASINKC